MMGRIAREIRYCDTERFKYRGEKRLSKQRPSHRPKSTAKTRAPPAHLAYGRPTGRPSSSTAGTGRGRLSEEGVHNTALGLGHRKEKLYPYLLKTESEQQAAVIVKDLAHKRAGSSYQVSSDRYNLTSLEHKQTDVDDVTSDDVTKTTVDSENSFSPTDKHDHLLDVKERQNVSEILPSDQSDKHVGHQDGTSGVLVRMYDRCSEEQGAHRKDQYDVIQEVVPGHAANVELHAVREMSAVCDTSEEFLQDLVKGIVTDALDGALISYSVGPGFRNCYIDTISTKICVDAMAKVKKYIYRNDSCTEGWKDLESTAANLVLNAMKHALDIKNRCDYTIYDKNDEGRDERSTQQSQTECGVTTSPDSDTVIFTERKDNDVCGSVDDLVGMAVYMLLI